ncbi:hypothetical protein BGW36DRAFT_429720 [Talaromyces proteolyticus]|uniref:Uncharacterized protein n=1 Tax=Talaromyces proteolyticus TaxID=1131652 RepID=A0AAD4KL60_9EURO|nr:uncharacterized protein BGW36DRAFT_429720 [Talaromyces proteolyticus]KAH8693681.1 hypothetical protein BGW36DRAFT_429720 [Talaromyces proteolyticus]
MSTICIIQPNPDVTGTGIRISIYVLALGGRIAEFIASQIGDHEDAKELKVAVDSTLSVQGLAVLFTAVIQTFLNKLTLFHAICSIHLLALLGISLPRQVKYENVGPLRLYVWIGIKVSAGCVFIVFATYIWATAKTFGVQPECNASTVYVVFGISIPATSTALRWVMVGTLALTALGTLIGVIMMISFSAFFMWQARRHPNDWETFRYREQRPIEAKSKIEQWMGMINTSSVNIYAMVSLEQTIARNNIGPGEKDWTFGQIIAIFMLVGVVNEGVNFGLAYLDRLKREGRHGD